MRRTVDREAVALTPFDHLQRLAHDRVRAGAGMAEDVAAHVDKQSPLCGEA
jgi:hypothetical protein